MRCVYRAFDHLEAEIVAGLLRAEGCLACVFENGLSRLKWFQVIAFGGALVVVPDECAEQAIQVIACWERGDYRLDDDDLRCPRCTSTDVGENPNFRGWAFFLGCFLAAPLFPMLKWRERCNTCGYRWKDARTDTYAELKALSDKARATSHGR